MTMRLTAVLERALIEGFTNPTNIGDVVGKMSPAERAAFKHGSAARASAELLACFDIERWGLRSKTKGELADAAGFVECDIERARRRAG